jgi:hypothetical protein
MTISVRRLVSTMGSATLFGLLLSTSTGCGTLSAMANPKVAWAVQDPAPMSVVVRRADAAQATTKEVDRLLTATPTSLDSDWMLKVGPDPKEAAADMKALTQDPMYQKSRARVVEAEVWRQTLPNVQSTSGDHPNLLSAIDQDLGDQYTAIMSKKQEIGALAAQIEEEKTAADAKDATADDKKTHSDAVTKLAKAKSDKETEVAPLQKTFLASVKTAASKVPADQQAKYLPAIANMLAALDDADIANSAAAVRYPLAIRSIKDSLMEVVPVITADVLEEKLGTRPTLVGLKPTVTLSGSSVAITLAGIDPGDLGQLDMGDLTKEVISRSGKWVVHAMTLLGTVNSTKEMLSFEHDALAGIMAGWAPPAAGVTLVIKIPAASSPEVMAAVAAPHVSLSAKAHAGPVGGPAVGTATVSAATVVKPGAAAAPGTKPKTGAATKPVTKKTDKADPKTKSTTN